MENNVEEVFITTGNHVAATDYELSYAADAFVLVVNRSRDDFFKVQMKDAIGYISPLRIRAADSGGKVNVPAWAVSFVCWLGPYHRLLGVHISPRLVAQTRSPYDLINYGHPSVVTCLAYAADKEKVRFPSNGRVGGKGGLRGRTRAGGKGGLRGKRVGLEGKGGLRLKVKKRGHSLCRSSAPLRDVTDTRPRPSRCAGQLHGVRVEPALGVASGTGCAEPVQGPAGRGRRRTRWPCAARRPAHGAPAGVAARCALPPPAVQHVRRPPDGTARRQPAKRRNRSADAVTVRVGVREVAVQARSRSHRVQGRRRRGRPRMAQGDVAGREDLLLFARQL